MKCFCMGCMIVLLGLGSVAAVQATQAKQDTELITDAHPFTYNSENWSDPFVPFLRATEAKQREKPPEEPLVGMQRFEPGQLNLVGVVQTGASYVAMVEDSTGKGYTIQEGMMLGRYGRVTEITADRISVTQHIPDPLGKVRKSIVTMELPTK